MDEELPGKSFHELLVLEFSQETSVCLVGVFGLFAHTLEELFSKEQFFILLEILRVSLSIELMSLSLFPIVLAGGLILSYRMWSH